MKIIAVIPARMASSRFPGKPLVPILGLPMIEHVRRRVALSKLFSDVVVATCDKEIENVVISSGGKAIMTSKKHERCTDRIAEAAEKLEAEIIVLVQGDEPLVMPDMFNSLIEPLVEYNHLYCVNMMGEIANEKELYNQNIVKVVFDVNENAMFFSREPIPSSKLYSSSFTKYKQLGIIAFRKDFLLKFTKLSPTPMEIIESIDMLRILENGFSVRMVKSDIFIVGVDTPEDLKRVEKIMEHDPIFTKYS